MLEQNHDYKIKNLISDKTRDNKNMKRFYLRSLSTGEEYKCVIWEDMIASLDDNVIKNGNIINVISFVFKENFNTYTLTKLKLVKESPVGLSPQTRDKLYERLISTTNSFKNEKLKTAILEELSKNEKLLKISSAAERMHHNYVGGLLLHINECLDISNKLFEITYQKVDRELILAACITHDLGKMFEYEVDEETGDIQRSEKFDQSWLSHIYYGFSWANSNGFDKLAHIIASHHGRVDWGAIVEPKTIEARLFHHIDDISAHLGRLGVDEIDSLNV
ncbi:MAG TPA: HD domain-containing protein [Candidatus Adamsella sp.]|nr:HD domain-containing protein [Candidatus Adamsella sp.]